MAFDEMQLDFFVLSHLLSISNESVKDKLKYLLRLVFTSDGVGVGVGVVIRSVELMI